MKRFQIISVCGLMLSICENAFPQGGKCTDTPVAFTLSSTHVDNTTPAAVYSDGASYVNGFDGIEAVIHVCGTNASGDATLNLGKSSRYIGFNFAAVIPFNANTPAWATAPQHLTAFLNIHNLLFNYGANGSYSFTSQFSSTITGPDRANYHLRFFNPSAQTQYAVVSSPDLVNTPYPTSLINIQHTPASNGMPESWTLYPTQIAPNPGFPATQIGGLVKDSKGGSSSVSAGQFTMPFVITVTRLQ